jgi:hypothetical protein
MLRRHATDLIADGACEYRRLGLSNAQTFHLVPAICSCLRYGERLNPRQQQKSIVG